MSTQELTHTLVESFNTLADEVQNLSDRQTVLEHKLRYAHEQFQYVADKYARAAPEIAETLVKLQIPPELHSPSLATTNFVPLPRRKASDSKHQIAVIIREGRRVASALSDPSKSSRSSRDSCPPTTMTSLSTILEQDFTVEGKRGTLGCPFSQAAAPEPESDAVKAPSHDNTPHKSSDPMCAAMLEETGSQQTSGAANKCPIRYLDQHTPEEIAHYLETHKHELPRSHEVCVRRYQRNEDDIRKLDAKYGNLVSMVEGLSRIHQPMLPDQDTRPQSDVEGGSNERVETWAQTVSATLTDDPDRTALEANDENDDDEERQSHFDRPLKEVRVGESPSRPWGISVPIFDSPAGPDGQPQERPESPPPAPVQMPSGHPTPETPAKKGRGKCPFDHTKLSQMMNGNRTAVKNEDTKSSTRLADVPAAATSHQHYISGQQNMPPTSGMPYTPAQPHMPRHEASNPFTSARQRPLDRSGDMRQQPTFISAAEFSRPKQEAAGPQMLFTGPVFIGYPMEQAIQFMQHFKGQ